MHHHPHNQERALNLSILNVSGPGEFPRVESKSAACATPRPPHPSTPLGSSLTTGPPPEPTHLGSSQGAERVEYEARPLPRRESLLVRLRGYMIVFHRLTCVQ